MDSSSQNKVKEISEDISSMWIYVLNNKSLPVSALGVKQGMDLIKNDSVSPYTEVHGASSQPSYQRT